MTDGYTKILTEKINDWGLDKIYEMEDNIYDLANDVPEIIDYLKDIHFSMPLGLALRRYMCERFSKGFDAEKQCYIFELYGRTVQTKDYSDESYDIENDDIPEYIEIFNYINEKYNTDENGTLSPEISKAEIRRQLRAVTGCIRKKMFELSFALHMDSEYTSKFLTDVLAEQTYNYREPAEIIALFCQSNEIFNSYQKYKELCKSFELRSKTAAVNSEKKEQYTLFARETVSNDIQTEEELMDFLLANIANFHCYSETAYSEYISLYVRVNSFLHYRETDDDFWSRSVEEKTAVVKERISDGSFINPEQLAKEMLACVPRATFERIKDGKTIVNNDFININNDENRQDSQKVKTTDLPKKITMNLPVSDRIWDLIRREKPVDRKDLVFMKFYAFSLYLQEKEEYSTGDYFTFLEECNDMLIRCGMSKLYPGNRFENLIMLSLLASKPFEMFENIIEYSFKNEPQANS